MIDAMRSGTPGPMAGVVAAYGLTGRQAAVLGGLVAAGSVRRTAAMLDIPYPSVRNAVAELKAKLGVATLPMLVGHVQHLIDGAGPSPAAHDLFELSERQFAIACAAGVAGSREETAALVGVSAAVLDAELKTIHLILGVRSAAELARVVADARHAELPALGHALPLAMVRRGERGIAYSDFGPAGARPVLILHSTITARAPPTRLVAALIERGFRPLAIDRPGFGDSDMAPPSDPAGDPFAAAADDAAAACAGLGLARVDVIARGSGQAAVRLAQRHPGLIGRAVLVNPTPAAAFTSADRGPLGAVKRRFARAPRAAEAMIRLLAAFATPTRMHDGMLRSFRDSPPDMALARDDPQFVADYLRATRGFADGRIEGYVAEQVAWAGGYDVASLAGMRDWRIVQGRHFVLHDPAEAMRYWGERLPDTPVRWVAGAGQLLAYSHAGAVVAALE